jgi:hypothetical protein
LSCLDIVLVWLISSHLVNCCVSCVVLCGVSVVLRCLVLRCGVLCCPLLSCVVLCCVCLAFCCLVLCCAGELWSSNRHRSVRESFCLYDTDALSCLDHDLFLFFRRMSIVSLSFISVLCVFAVVFLSDLDPIRTNIILQQPKRLSLRCHGSTCFGGGSHNGKIPLIPTPTLTLILILSSGSGHVNSNMDHLDLDVYPTSGNVNSTNPKPKTRNPKPKPKTRNPKS